MRHYGAETEKLIILNKPGPIVVIEDDSDDQELLTEIFYDLNYKNKILFFNEGEEALNYLNHGNDLPFLIQSDINMPKLNGFAFTRKIKNGCKLK